MNHIFGIFEFSYFRDKSFFCSSDLALMKTGSPLHYNRFVPWLLKTINDLGRFRYILIFGCCFAVKSAGL